MAAAWMAMIRRERLAAGLALLIVGPLLAAYAFRDLYGGSMNRQGGEDGVLSSAGSLVILMVLIGFGLIAAIVSRAKSGSLTKSSLGTFGSAKRQTCSAMVEFRSEARCEEAEAQVNLGHCSSRAEVEKVDHVGR